MRYRFKGICASLAVAMLAASAPVFAQNTAPEGAPAAASSPQVSQPDESGVNWKGVGVGAGTVAGNLLYVPAKLVYGILGGIGGGAGYVLTGGNQQVADTIWRSSLGGDYVLTPDMITGKEPVHFSGPTQTEPPAADNTSDPNAPGATTQSSAPASTGGSTSTKPIDNGAGPVPRSTSLNSAPAGSSAASPPGSSSSMISAEGAQTRGSSGKAGSASSDKSIE